MILLNSSRYKFGRFGLFVLLVMFVLAPISNAANRWEEIPEEELRATSPRIDPDADAEVLYRGIDVDDPEYNANYHYRIKIFTEVGVAFYEKIKIDYDFGRKMDHLQARIVYPDGEILTLSKESFFRRKEHKKGSYEKWSTSFSFPNLSPGCIIEYKWKEETSSWSSGGLWRFLEEWPTWHFHISIRPSRYYSSRLVAYNCNYVTTFDEVKYRCDVTDLPKQSEEPNTPPSADFEPFLYLKYGYGLGNMVSDNYWDNRSEYLEVLNSTLLKKNKRMKKFAKELYLGIDNSESKLKAAYRYCTNDLSNLMYASYTQEELEKLKFYSELALIVKHGYGFAEDINAVFASLAQSAGYEVELVEVEDNALYSFNPYTYASFNLDSTIVALKREGEEWRFFDPGSKFLPFESLLPTNVNATVLFPDEETHRFGKTPDIDPEANRTVRKGYLNINEFGDLSGRILIEYSGFEAFWRRQMLNYRTLEEFKEYVEEPYWQGRFPRATIANIEVENEFNLGENFIIQYDLEIPAYASVMEDRILLTPSIFDTDKEPVFTSETREADIAFEYKKVELDTVHFSIPDGYRFEEKEQKPIGFSNSLMDIDARWVTDSNGGGFVFDRSFRLKWLKVPRENYKKMKFVFNTLHAVDDTPVSFVRN